jgi:hypothetical protein
MGNLPPWLNERPGYIPAGDQIRAYWIQPIQTKSTPISSSIPVIEICKPNFCNGWICVGPLSDGEDKNRTFLSWLVRATWMSGADGTP